MGLLTKKILGIRITISPKKEVLEKVQKYLLQIPNSKFQIPNKRRNPLIIFTPNPEIITYAQKDSEFRRIVNSAQINLPDGWGVVWAFKKLFGLTIEKITGVDFIWELCAIAKKEGFSVGLIGGRGGVAVSARECLLLKYQNLKIEVFDGPEIEIKNEKLKIKNYNLKIKIKQESDGDTSGVTEWAPPMVEESEDRYFNSLAKEIIKRKIDILFVGLGFPKQEYFVENLKNHLKNYLEESGPPHALKKKDSTFYSGRLNSLNQGVVLMAVGGAFDYLSGRIPRAPIWIRNRGLEWLYRLIREPWRLKRQIKGAEFFYRILTHAPESHRFYP